MVAPFGSAYFAFQRVHKFPVIGQPRQGVVRSLIANLVFAPLPLRDVDPRANAANNFPGWPTQRPKPNLKVSVSMAVFEVRGHSSQCFCVLCNRHSVWILALQIFVDCPPDKFCWLASC